jgi:charged multivesicular body protein 7
VLQKSNCSPQSATQSLLSQISKGTTSATSGIHSLTTFTHAYSHLFGSTNAPLSPRDTQILLTYLTRDKPSLSWDPSTGTINLSSTQPITQNDISIAQLKTLLLTLSTTIPILEDRQSSLAKKAREAVAAKQNSSAKAALRSKKVVEETLDRRRANALQLEEILTKIDEAHDQVAMVRVMESSAAVLKNLNKEIGGVERVEKATENLRDQMDRVEDVNRVINEVGAEGATADEAEVDEEFEALERAEREKVEKAEAEARRVEEERKAEETRRRLVELEELEKKRKEIEAQAQAQKSPEVGQEEKQEPEVQQPEQPEQITLPERPAPSEDRNTREDERQKESPIAVS